MKRFILIVTLLLAVFLLAIHYLGGKFISQLVDEEVERINRQSEHIQLSYDNLTISPLFASAKIQNLDFSDADSGTALTAIQINGSLSLSDLLSALLNGFRGDMDGIERLSFHANGLSYRNETTSEFINTEVISFNWNGNIQSLYYLLEDQSIGNHAWNFEVSAEGIDISPHYARLFFARDFLPEINRIQEFNTHLRFDSNKHDLEVRYLRFNAIHSTFSARGNVIYSHSNDNIFNPNEFHLPFILSTPVNSSFRLPISEHIGNMSFRSIRLESTLSGINGTISRNLPEGSTYIKLDRPVLYPSDILLRTHGFLLQSLPVNPREITARELEIEFHKNNNNLNLEQATLKLATFDFLAYAQTELNSDNPGSSEIINGKIQVTNADASVIDFIRNFEMLFETTFDRDGSDIIIPVKGTLSRPVLDLGM